MIMYTMYVDIFAHMIACMLDGERYIENIKKSWHSLFDDITNSWDPPYNVHKGTYWLWMILTTPESKHSLMTQHYSMAMDEVLNGANLIHEGHEEYFMHAVRHEFILRIYQFIMQ